MFRAPLLVLLALLPAPPALSQCRVASAPACAIELRGEKGPRASEACTSEAWKEHLKFQLPERFADANRDGWHESVLELDLHPDLGCGCVVFRIEFEGEPTGEAANIGDSPTNDGFGGDADSTIFDAEIMVRYEGVIAVYNADLHGTPVGSELALALQHLPFKDATVELEVCDQSVSFNVDRGPGTKPIEGVLNAGGSGDLLAIRRPTGGTVNEAKEIGADSLIYAAFNRVVHRRSGRPAQERFGTGTRRVEISLTP